MLQGAALQIGDGKAAAIIQQSLRVNGSAADLVSTILDYSRIDDLRSAPLKVLFDVSGIFDDLMLIYQPIAAEKSVDIAFGASTVSLFSDRNLLMQALSNFLDNAIRSSRAGDTVLVTCERQAETVRILVTDAVEQGTTRPGAAGYGYGIINRIAQVLGAEIIHQDNSRGLLFDLANT